MIAVTEAKLIWKLGPASASGRKMSTISAPTATRRRLMASRPQRNAKQDQQRRGDAGRNEDEVEAEGQPFAQREELEAEQHRGGDHRGDVQSANREQMGQTARAHRIRIVLGHAVLVAGDQRDGNTRLVTQQPAMDVARKALANGFKPATTTRLHDLDRP
jgi:hypothetical protein